jgi:dihydropteroate synthase
LEYYSTTIKLVAKDTVFYKKNTLNLAGKIVDLSTPAVMGIMNTTPDSFFKGSRFENEKEIIVRAGNIIEEGGLIIDVGGYSSRPGAEDITEEEEIQRVVPAIKLIKKEFTDVFISVDTFRSNVARLALESGACIINDISGGIDPEMYKVAAQYKAAYILMHMKGTPQNMISEAQYGNLLNELLDYFSERLWRLNGEGVKDVIIDPGFGFAKTINHNFNLLGNLNYFEILSQPLLVGLSRKSMIYKKLGISSDEALNGTTVLNTIALMKGASILRVHDVKEAYQAVKLFKLAIN